MVSLHDLQTKPKSIKARYAIIGACVFTGLIGIVWVSTLPARFASMGDAPASKQVETENTSAFKGLFDNTKRQFDTLFATVGEAIEGEAEMEQIAEGSALGALAPETASTSSGGEQSLSTEESGTKSDLESSFEARLEAQTPGTTSSPRVIYIATTSVQKSE